MEQLCNVCKCACACACVLVLMEGSDTVVPNETEMASGKAQIYCTYGDMCLCLIVQQQKFEMIIKTATRQHSPHQSLHPRLADS